jgi:hypothetical protein
MQCIPALKEIEPLLTLREAAAMLRWSYDSARRYFKDVPGVLVKTTPKRFRRPYKTYMIPQSVFRREWTRMASFNAGHDRHRTLNL